MNIKRKPKTTVAIFAGGTTLLIAGAAVAATLSPSSARMLHMADAKRPQTTTSAAPTAATSTAATTSGTTSATTSATTSVRPTSTAKTTTAPSATSTTTTATRHRPSAAKTAADKAPITYTVRKGDTLSGIAAWFKLHGYGDLYAANAKVIGADPNLIHPGERITIGSHIMKVQGPA